MVGRGVWGMRAPVSLTVVVMALGLSACGSMVAMEREAPDGTRISRLEFLTAYPQAGCPIDIRVHVDAAAADAMQVGVGWARLERRSRDSGRERFTVAPSAGHDVVVRLVPERRGVYAYQVQIGDVAGRWSNVLRARLAVDGAASEEASRCS